MRKEINFDLFQEGETIYFNNFRMRSFEKAIGRSLMPDTFLFVPKLTFDETIAGLKIGLQHHYPKATDESICDKLDTYYEKTGEGVQKATDLVSKALIASGFYGKALDDIINEGKSIEETEIKNE